jgi:hypothetical protein
MGYCVLPAAGYVSRRRRHSAATQSGSLSTLLTIRLVAVLVRLEAFCHRQVVNQMV